MENRKKRTSEQIEQDESDQELDSDDDNSELDIEDGNVFEENESEEEAELEEIGHGNQSEGEKIEDEVDNDKKKKKSDSTEDKRGIIYLSRIPPYMKIPKLRHTMSQFGDVERIYLKPEEYTSFQKRKKHGGNKKMKYTEGWIEFKKKKMAKLVAMSLNNTPMGGPKSYYYRDDIWNIKYLSKFKWFNLTEKMVYAKAVRSKRLRMGISQNKRIGEEYMKKTELTKTAQKIKERKEGKKLKKEQEE